VYLNAIRSLRRVRDAAWAQYALGWCPDVTILLQLPFSFAILRAGLRKNRLSVVLLGSRQPESGCERSLHTTLPRGHQFNVEGVSHVVYSDKTLQCRECGADFIFTAGEQEFYAAKGLMNEPARCPECRAARRARLSGSGLEMGVRRELHPAICASCGVETQVPFLPRGDRPVYCSSCFDRVRAGASI